VPRRSAAENVSVEHKVERNAFALFTRFTLHG
jgi:hypothetical protein